jgi:hypothetical protein
MDFEHWDTKHILAAAQSEVTESGKTLTFARLTKPAEWKIPTTMLQKLSVRRPHENVCVRVAADFRIPRNGGPATILIECINTDAPQTEAAKYGMLLTRESSPTPADDEWHTQEVNFVAPQLTNQLRIFIKVAGDANVDLTRVILTVKTER